MYRERDDGEDSTQHTTVSRYHDISTISLAIKFIQIYIFLNHCLLQYVTDECSSSVLRPRTTCRHHTVYFLRLHRDTARCSRKPFTHEIPAAGCRTRVRLCCAQDPHIIIYNMLYIEYTSDGYIWSAR